MFENTFLLKIYPKPSKKLQFTSLGSDDDQRDFVTPSYHSQCTMRLTVLELHFKDYFATVLPKVASGDFFRSGNTVCDVISIYKRYHTVH